MVGGGQTSSKNTSSSKAEGWSRDQSTNANFGSAVWDKQAGYLQDLWGAGKTLMTGGLAGEKNPFEILGNNMMQRGAATLDAMQNPGVNPQLQAYNQRLGQDFRENYLPSLQGQAIQAGGLGGSRQQIGAAMGADRAMQASSDFAANVYSGDQQRALEASQSGLQGGMAMSQFGQAMPWYALQQQQGLLGGPTILDQGGYGQSTGESYNKSTSTGSGGSSGWNASFFGG